jgi:hypothetical protein
MMFLGLKFLFCFSYRMPSLDENPMYNNKLHIKFDPPLLDFRERLVNIYCMYNSVSIYIKL